MLLPLLTAATVAVAQQRLVNEVKKEISGLSVTVDSYKSSLKKIQKALENEETKDNAEPWWVAGKIQYSIYDKMMNNKAAGEKISNVDAGAALLDGYEKFSQALKLDTIVRRDKNGNPIIDKKTGQPRVKTRYSQDIINRHLSHMIDYSAVAGDYYLAGDWDKAYKAWDIYCSLAKSTAAKRRNKEEPDSIVGYNRFFQGLAAYQGKNYENAVEQLARARNLGYRKKALYDTWIDALVNLHDTIYMVSVAHEAHDRLGSSDPRYVRILINHYLKNKNYDEAQSLLDEVIATDSTVAEYYNMKGKLIDNRLGPDAAMPYYRKAVELNPEFGMGLFDLGNALYNKAIEAGEHNPTEARRLYNESLPYLERAYKINPKSEKLKNILSRIYYMLGSNKLDTM